MPLISAQASPLNRLYHALERLREDGDRDIGNGQVFTMATAMTFLAIAARPNQGVSQLAELCGVPVQSVSRHLLDLSTGLRSGRVSGGLDLVTYSLDPADARRRLYNLTPKGEDLASALATILEQ